ncbi:2'-5' RNA ligase [Paucibacter oligotrophus]|uniref:2'-5' RNA ligase n=1 Tax=Roseateles oligotrophus TaxID=1769250 RepID=A0A840LFV6_9BURK|nr:2'-5' RNA ligase family protein [Roseateles oligotrophus]MBB4845513.1 2'-5' RNA ligase [Roseateles oligotrophus]
MPSQLNLPGFDPEAARPVKPLVRPQGIHSFKHKLFFAIFPAPEDARRILQRAESLRQQHRFTEELIEAERLHITLQVLGDYVEQIPVQHIEAALQAAARIRTPSFALELDHALSFQGSGAFVFSDKKRESPFATFRRNLVQELTRQGFPPHPGGTPHMTLLYSHHHLIAEAAIRPLHFHVKDFALIHSHTGKHWHEELGRWNLSV